MELNLEKVRANVERATTEDLLDRATIYRAGMEPEALAIIEDELRRRGLTEADLAAHEEDRGDSLIAPEGYAWRCYHCERPAVVAIWGWHYLWEFVPVFPRVYRFCNHHR